jgi:integrase
VPRPLSGSILTRRLADDTLVVDVKIRGELRCLGPASEWSEARVRNLLENRLLPAARLRQDWTALIPGTQLGSATDAGIRSLTVREAATEYVESLGRYENPKTLDAYRSPVVKHLLPFLAYVDDARTEDRALVDVDEALMLRFVAAKQAERAVLQDVAETLAELDRATRADLDLLSREFDEDEWRLLRRYGQRGGRHKILDPSATGVVSLSSRGLSNNEINRCLARMRDIVRMANRRYKLGVDDPTQGCSLPREDPSREWLHPVQMQALIDAAETLDANPAQDAYAQHGRYSAILALGLLGPRVSEFCAARWRDLSAEGLYIPEAKTSAGRRHLELPTIVRTALEQRRAELDPRPSDWIWASAAGTKRDRNNVRNRLLAPVLELAADLLEERGQRPLPARVDADGNPTGIRVTPHMFRRTAMTYWAWADRNQRWAMGQAGHKSAKMTLEAYQQTFPRDHDARALVSAWLRGAGAGTA